MNKSDRDPPQSPPPALNLMARTDIAVAAILVGFLFLTVGKSSWPNGETVHESIEMIGLVLIMISIFGRMWCSIYIGGRKRHALVTYGPYSVCRNPIFDFTIIGAVGVGAQVGSAVVASVCGLIAWFVMQRAARKEEAALLSAFGDAYSRYRERVPRFWPKFSLWYDREMVEVWPQTVVSAFLDASIFLVAVPVAEGIEYLHDINALPVLMILP
jgi:protein-S-isoprenylcysteine O-methyltransferase Ste14